MKYVYEEVENCEKCPWLRTHSEYPGKYCGCPYTSKKYKDLWSEERPYPNFVIPDWCPLPEE